MVAIDMGKVIRPTNFQEFYAYYLVKHRDQFCRRLHLIGTLLGGIMSIIGIATLNGALSAAGVASGVALCTVGDVLIQRIKPTYLEYPIWSTRANFHMVVNMIKGTESI